MMTRGKGFFPPLQSEMMHANGTRAKPGEVKHVFRIQKRENRVGAN